MRAVGLKVLKHKLSEYVRLAAGGERVLVMDRDRVVAEIVPPEPDALWSEALVTSRLTHHETWVRLHARRLSQSHAEIARETLGRLAIVERSPLVLERALEPFPSVVRALDAMHLAALSFLAGRRQRPKLATFDLRLADAATRLGFELHPV
jgi:antitoxin (DNA-binding transcriptional repressor) of toxin-antitoxin stability system